MHDPRIRTLAKNLIGQSVRLQPGEKILIENIGLELPLVTALVEEAQKAGGSPSSGSRTRRWSGGS
jgi:aminopeptidase